MDSAIKADDLERVRQIIIELKDDGKLFNLNKPNPRNGLCPIHLACLQGNAAIVKELLDEGGVSLVNEDRKGRLPLHCAVESGNKVVLEEVIRATEAHPGWLERSMKLRDLRGWTPLHIVTSSNNFNQGRDPLQAAEQLLDHMPADISSNGRSNFLCKLPKEGTRKAPATDTAVHGVLHKAILSGAPQVAQLLLHQHNKLGILSLSEFLNDVDADGKSLLIVASSQGYYDLVHEFVELGADLRCVDNQGQNAAHWAFAMNHNDIGEYLLSLPDAAQIASQIDHNGFTPIDWRDKIQNDVHRIEQEIKQHHEQKISASCHPPKAPHRVEPDTCLPRQENPERGPYPKLVPGSPVYSARGEAKWEEDREALRNLICQDSERLLQRGIEACNIADDETADRIEGYLEKLESTDLYWNAQGA